jgi:hypothetical protein
MTAVHDALVEGLFVAILECDYTPNGRAGAARHAAFTELKAYGTTGCARVVATEYGAHPVEAADRMAQAYSLVGAR